MLLRPTLPILLTAATLSAATLCLGQSAPPKRTVIRPQDLPKPYATSDANNGGKVVPRPDGAEIKLPPGFKAEVFAENFSFARYVTAAPCGDLFVSEAGSGSIVVLRPGNDGKCTLKETFAEGLTKPFGILFHKDGMYVGTADSVVRFAYKDGQTKADGAPKVILSNLPTEGHWTHNLAYSPKTGKLYIGIGSSKDYGEETDERRATVCEFNPDGTGFRIFATGLRNAVGLATHPKSGEIWATVQERDHLGDDIPPDYVTSVKEGGFYSWPYYYTGANHDPRVPEKPELAKKAIAGDVLLTAHTAAMCLLFYTGNQFPKEYQGDAFVALHGSGNRAKRVGYSIVRVPFNGNKPEGGFEDFATGWMMGEDDNRVWGRPVGLAQGKDGALYLVDDGTAKLWRISYEKKSL